MKLSFFSLAACCVFFLCMLTVPAARAAADGGSRLSRGKIHAPQVIAPADLAEFRGADHVTFRWRGVQGAAAYHLVLARDRRFKNIVSENSHVTGTSYVVGNLNYGTYFFEISSVSAGGTEGPFSQRLSFIVVPPPPAVAPPEGPRDNSRNQ